MISEYVRVTFCFQKTGLLGNDMALSSNLPFRKYLFPSGSSLLRNRDLPAIPHYISQVSKGRIFEHSSYEESRLFPRHPPRDGWMWKNSPFKIGLQDSVLSKHRILLKLNASLDGRYVV